MLIFLSLPEYIIEWLHYFKFQVIFLIFTSANAKNDIANTPQRASPESIQFLWLRILPRHTVARATHDFSLTFSTVHILALAFHDFAIRHITHWMPIFTAPPPYPFRIPPLHYFRCRRQHIYFHSFAVYILLMMEYALYYIDYLPISFFDIFTICFISGFLWYFRCGLSADDISIRCFIIRRDSPGHRYFASRILPDRYFIVAAFLFYVILHREWLLFAIAHRW